MGRDDWSEGDFAAKPGEVRDPVIAAELAPGEEVRWVGRPRTGRLVLPTLPFAGFGVIFIGFGLFWITSLTRQFDGGAFALFGVPFLLAGMAATLTPAWAVWVASRARYAVTDRRVLLLVQRFGAGVEVRSYGPEALANIVRTRRSNGSGDLIFEEIRTVNREGHDWVIRRGFLGIEDVRHVEDLIRSTLLAGQAAP